ncbi:MAG: twin-arginine translocation signal domain-containing protein, partial [Helicobacter sp.]|nr:twin-arginine translocation signal domain-containing protein [Helicobacter sp.]
MMKGLNRRHFLKGIATVGAGVLSPAILNADSKTHSPRTPTINNPYPFFGIHQEGIITPAQKHIYFLVLDLHTNS